MCKISIPRLNIITLHNLIRRNQYQPLICNFPSSRLSNCESFSIPLIISNLINRATFVCGMHLILRSKPNHYYNRSSMWPLPLFTDFNLEFSRTSSIYEIVSNCRSISAHILSIQYFHQLTHSANMKTWFVRTCLIYEMLQRR